MPSQARRKREWWSQVKREAVDADTGKLDDAPFRHLLQRGVRRANRQRGGRVTRVEMVPTASGDYWLVYVPVIDRVVSEGKNPQLALERAVRSLRVR